MFTVDVYSGCEKVELFLNGESIGVQPTTRKEKFTASFEVPFAHGALKAVGYSGDQPAVECELKTAGPATRLRLSPDRSAIRAESADLCFITAEITDDLGHDVSLREPAKRIIPLYGAFAEMLFAIGAGIIRQREPQPVGGVNGSVFRLLFRGLPGLVVLRKRRRDKEPDGGCRQQGRPPQPSIREEPQCRRAISSGVHVAYPVEKGPNRLSLW